MFNKETTNRTQEKRFLGKWVVLTFLLISILLPQNSNAQCAMCRAALSSEGNKTKAAAVNDGIVYLMVIPYLLVGGIGYAVYRMRKNKK
ncbi:hypothetical protein H4V97_002403 [Flavobacterium sp. CG_23.5]|uniref:hypothetical protein n=1 Tax=unclassified Flavobacterium TaxID=196869 RepID=UPI0018C9387D|nr:MULTISPECIES: hypothetical protein [unclassified Flavobacterium]MBG6110485.1 hypothetical protein [Flavobacterium sp. CG_9.10]MBP2284085.1 hypothetical protein [Flavobacterium sp. CG_23.5]